MQLQTGLSSFVFSTLFEVTKRRAGRVIAFAEKVLIASLLNMVKQNPTVLETFCLLYELIMLREQLLLQLSEWIAERDVRPDRLEGSVVGVKMSNSMKREIRSTSI